MRTVEDYVIFKSGLPANLPAILKFIEATKQPSTPDVEKYDLLKVSAKNKLNLFFEYSNYIDFDNSKENIEEKHNLSNFPDLKFDVISCYFNSEPLRIKTLISELSDEVYKYDEYLKIKDDFSLSKTPTDKLLEIEKDDNSYFSKPFLLYLKELHGENSLIRLCGIKFKKSLKNSILIEVCSEKTNKNVQYDISYNPPNGNPAKK